MKEFLVVGSMKMYKCRVGVCLLCAVGKYFVIVAMLIRCEKNIKSGRLQM